MNCNACNGNVLETISLPSGDSAVRCQECGLVGAKNVNTSKQIYESAYDAECEGFTYNSYLEANKRIGNNDGVPLYWFEKKYLNKIKPYGKKELLEVGCGNGRFLLACSKIGWHVHGLDISEKAIELARGILPENDIKSGSLEGRSWPDQTFDTITMWELIEHVDDPYKTVSKAKDLLQDNGLLAISTPDWDSWATRRHPDVNRWPPFHIWFFNESSIKALLKRAGMKVVSMQRNIFPWSETSWPKWKRLIALPWLVWLGVVLGQGGGRLVIWAKKA